MAHHTTPNGDTYVDSDFINDCQRISGVTLSHMGFGEFYAETPKGRVDFDRMRGKDFPGQSGRSHLLSGKGGADEWLVKQMERAGKSKRVASRSRGTEPRPGDSLDTLIDKARNCGHGDLRCDWIKRHPEKVLLWEAFHEGQERAMDDQEMDQQAYRWASSPLRSRLVRLASKQAPRSPERKALLAMLADKTASKVDFPSDVKSDLTYLHSRLSNYYDQAKREGGPEMKNHLTLVQKALRTAVGLNAQLHRAEEALYY